MKQVVILIIILLGSPIKNYGNNIDSLTTIFNGEDTLAVLAGYELSLKYLKTDADRSLDIIKKSITLAKKLDYRYGEMLLLKRMGSILFYESKLEKSSQASIKGLKVLQDNNFSPIHKVDFLINLGAVKSYLGNTGEAIELYIEGVKLCRENNYQKKHSKLLNNLGVFYRKLGNYTQALEIYDQAYEWRKTINDSLGMANVLLNKTAVLAKMKRSEESLESLESALAIYTVLHQEKDIELCILSKAMALYDLGKTNKSLQLLLQLDKDNSFEDLQHSYNLYLTLAEIMIKKNKCHQAITYLHKIKKEVLESNLMEQLQKYHYLESDAYRCLGQMSNAYTSLSAFNTVSQDILSKENQLIEEEMQAKYESVEKDYKIELLNNENEISELKLASTKTRNQILLLGLALLGIFSLTLIWLYRKISTQNHQLEKSEKEKSLLLKEIHHRVKNNLQVISSLLSLQARKVKDTNTKEALNTSKSRVQSMAILHQSLYNNKDLKGIKTDVYFENLVTNIADIHKISENVDIQIKVEPITVDIDLLTPLGLIANELICNSLKHGFDGIKEQKLWIQLSRIDKELHLHVKDNGIGFPNEKFEEIKTSIGIKLIKMLTESKNGRIIVTPGGGANILIIIPERN